MLTGDILSLLQVEDVTSLASQATGRGSLSLLLPWASPMVSCASPVSSFPQCWVVGVIIPFFS